MERRFTLKLQRFLLVLVKVRPLGPNLSLITRPRPRVLAALTLLIALAVGGATMSAQRAAAAAATPDSSAAACQAAGGTWVGSTSTAAAAAGIHSCDMSATFSGGSFIADQVAGDVLNHQLYYYLGACFSITQMDKVTTDQLNSWQFLYRTTAIGVDSSGSAVRGAMYSNVTASCADSASIKEAFGRFGLGQDPLATFCALNFTYSESNGGNGRAGPGGHNTQACLDGRGQGDFGADTSTDNQVKGLQKLLDATPNGPTAKAELAGPQEYVRQYQSFVKVCKPTFVRPYDQGAGAGGNAKAFKITVVNKAGYTQDWYVTSDVDPNTVAQIVANLSSSGAGYQTNSTCSMMAQAIDKNAGAYALWLQNNPDAAGAQSGNVANGKSGGSTTTCAIDGIGWMLCPILTAGGKAADGAFGFLADNFLQTDPSLLDTGGPDNGTYVAWTRFRDIANVAFVIVFLVLVYSQLTGLGVSNYGMKKMLPRLFIAAVLVNTSFWICAIAVDLSNILGFSIRSLFDGLSSGMVKVPENVDTATANASSGWGFAGLVTTVIVLGAGLWLALGALIPMLLAALVALAMILFILLARKALIVLLIVLAPLAFVAYLLPNTEQWFVKWRKAFFALLMVFPVIAVVFGASTMAAVIVKSSSNSTLNQIMAAGIAIIPLFVVPTLLKGSINAVGSIGSKINGIGGKAGGFASKKGAEAWGKSGMAAARNLRNGNRADRKARIKAGNFSGRGGWLNPRNLRSRAYGARNESGVYNTASGGYGAQQVLKAQAQNAKDTKEAIDMFRGDDELISAWGNDGGSKGPAYTALNATQKQQYDQMRAAGHHRKATSHMAAAQALSESGKGDATQITNAVAHAASAGASASDQEAARQAAIVAYRKSGRGDAVGDLTGAGRTDGWGQVAAESVHREGITQDGGASFSTYLNADTENTRKALAGFDKMEARAQNVTQAHIVAAAQAHQYAATGVAPTISSIQEAKDYYGIK